MKQLMVTGGDGFLGQALCENLKKAGYYVRRIIRSEENCAAYGSTADVVSVGDLGADVDWTPLLDGIDVVLHLAGRAHILNEQAADPLEEFRRVNVRATASLAQAAAGQGVRRMVFVSSIGVNGSSTVGKPFSEEDIPAPHNDYALSKWEAEKELLRIAADTGLEVTIVRSPLIYGPGVKAHFLQLLQLVEKGIPLPLGSVRNRRSFVALDNIVDFLVCCAVHPAAAGRTFLVCDGEDISTPELIRRIARYMRCPVRLWPFPVSVMRAGARFLGKQAVVESLCESLLVESTKAKRVLGWRQPVSIDDGLKKTVEWYVRKCGK